MCTSLAFALICSDLLWGSGEEVRHLPGKRGGDRRAGRMKWDWCCLLEEAHSMRLLRLGDNLLLVCENKMWSHTWLLFLLSHLPWTRIKMTCGSLCECVRACMCVYPSACWQCFASCQNKIHTCKNTCTETRKTNACRYQLLTGSLHRGQWKFVTHWA